MIVAALILGVVGSLHCAVMCGPLILAIPMRSRVLYHAGRIATYALLGGAAGLFGEALSLAGVQKWLSIGTGVLILAALAVSSLRNAAVPYRAVAFLKQRMAPLIKNGGVSASFWMGSINGLLPCGLVYAALATSAAAGGLGQSVFAMVAFGLGTVPMLLAVTFARKRLTGLTKLPVQRLIPATVAMVGLLLVARGLELGIPYISPVLSGANACCH